MVISQVQICLKSVQVYSEVYNKFMIAKSAVEEKSQWNFLIVVNKLLMIMHCYDLFVYIINCSISHSKRWVFAPERGAVSYGFVTVEILFTTML